MTRVKSGKTIKVARHNATTAKFKPSVPRLKGLPKRVQHGGRIIMTREEWGQCVEVYVRTNSYPTSKQKHELASSLDRCPKQLSIWFGNRRQDFAKADRKGIKFPTEESTRQFLWSKWRVQGQDDPETAFDSGSTDNVSDLTRASSLEISEDSISEAATPAPEADIEFAPTDPLLMLLEAAKMIDAKEGQASEVCTAILDLNCA
ncbi:homeobox domain protein [Ceratobasidium sp. AG-Ba]|nr:homeobox domain protein [Ceratobasidium sp. AG-Ba]